MDFDQLSWDEALEDDCRQLLRLAVREDLDRGFDVTTLALVADGQGGAAHLVARKSGIVAGLPAVETAFDEMDVQIEWAPLVEDGDALEPNQPIARVSGPARDLLTTERIVLNLVGRLSGIATLTRQYVDAVGDHPTRIYDTRKTTPGWRRLEKYAVRCGGGHNHRTGLFDAILIKDNHLALAAQQQADFGPAEALAQAHRQLEKLGSRMIVEIEVDTLEQLEQVLPAKPHIVLLDNMTPAEMSQAVRLRDQLAADVQLEASGGIELGTIADVAASGVDRISVGALTHSATSLDIGLDWDA